MQRQQIAPRTNWRPRMEAVGFSFHSMDGVYWDESACYRFATSQIDDLEAATDTLHSLCLDAVAHIIENDRFAQMRIPAPCVPMIRKSWEERALSLYGRFDLRYDGEGPPKLLEYNADTPTSILEAAVAQWHWLEDTGRSDQFNSLHEKIIEQWRRIANRLPVTATMYFSCIKDNEEDFVSMEYLRDTAIQAGLETRVCYIEDIGWNGELFVDANDEPIRAWFKLYPWEWLMREDYAQHLPKIAMSIVEPAWKALLSNKAILAILWELFPDHPNLLPAYFDASVLGEHFVRKPLFSREGANIHIQAPGMHLTTAGPYDTTECVYQKWHALPEFSGNYPVIGSWIIGDEAAGIGIREDDQPVTTNRSRFVPHYFE